MRLPCARGFLVPQIVDQGVQIGGCRRMKAPELLQTTEAAVAFVESLGDAPFLAVDTETTGLDPNTDRVLLVQVGTAERQGLIDAARVSAAVIRAIFRPDRLVVLHNATFDLKMLWGTFGTDLDLEHARVADSLLAELLIRNGRSSEVALRGCALNTLALRYAGMELDKSVREGFIGTQSVAELGETELRYAQRDVEATWKVFAEQLPLLERDGLMRVAAIEYSAAPAFAQMEFRGAAIDVDAWSKLLAEAESESQAKKKVLDQEFWSVANHDLFGGTTLNYDSDQEVLSALQRLGVALTSTRKEALFASGHPAARAVAEYREHQKIVSTYGQGFLSFVHAKTGRIHPRFAAMGATTGRASCKAPNLQNIPAGSSFRACFRAPRGRKLVTADYAGAELRILADVSGDPVFIQTLQDGGDLHAIVASRMFKKPVSRTENQELRARAKAINFGLAYGMGAKGLAHQLGVPEREGERLIEAYFRAFPKIRDYLNDSARRAQVRGSAETLSGRRFWFTDMRRDGRDEGSQKRVAKNMPIQGANADMTKLAMGRIVRAFRREGVDAFLVNMVHDEIVVEAAEEQATLARDIVVKEMAAAGAEFVRAVPMMADAQIGDAWSK